MSKARRLELADVFPDPGFRLNVMRQPDHGTLADQHSHGFHELVVVLDGHGTHAVGPARHEIEAGDVFVILGNMTHGYPETDALSIINVLYDPAQLGIPEADLGSIPGYHALFTVEPRIRNVNDFRNRLRLNEGQLGRAAELIARMEEELVSRLHGHGFMATTYLMQLVAHLSRCYSEIEPRKARPVAQISEVLGHMERHCADPLTIADLMRVAHMSQTSLMRTFRRVMGRSPIDHLIRLRISRAAILLRRTGETITDIGYRVGFNDSNYFSRQFRRLMNVSPREYRRQMR